MEQQNTPSENLPPEKLKEEPFKEVDGQIIETRGRVEVVSSEKQVWQATVDKALQDSDFALLEVLLRARPTIKPTLEVAQQTLNELVTKKPPRWKEHFSEAQKISGAEPDLKIAQQKYNDLLKKLNDDPESLKKLTEFANVVKCKPGYEQVQEKYKDLLANQYLRSSHAALFQKVKEVTNILPERRLFDELVKDGMTEVIKEYAPLFQVELSGELAQSIHEAHFIKTGSFPELPEPPNEATIQNVYLRIIKERRNAWQKKIEEIKQETGVEPRISEEKMQPIFADLFSDEIYVKAPQQLKDVIAATGESPSQELVLKRIFIITDRNLYKPNGSSTIKEHLQRLEQAIGKKADIPPEEIQKRYQQAIADKKERAVVNLHEVFNIKPDVDEQTAQQFLASCVDVDPSLFTALQKAFGTTLKMSADEVSAKFDEAFEELDFYKVKRIQKSTGMHPEKKKLEEALFNKLEKQALENAQKTKNMQSNWETYIALLFKDFGVVVSKERVIEIYEKLIARKIIDVAACNKVHKISEIAIPSQLAQKVYLKILHAERSDLHSYDWASSVLTIHEISDATPVLASEAELQHFYRKRIEGPNGGHYEIKTLARLTGVDPQFNASDISQLYKTWISAGQVERLKKCRDITGVDLQIDEETSGLISEVQRQKIAYARSKNYRIRKGYNKEILDKNTLYSDLNIVKELMEISGIIPDSSKLQKKYESLLQDDPECFTIISHLVKVTGVEPQFSPERTQHKGDELLESGSLKDFEKLVQYGEYSYSQETVSKGFDALIDGCMRSDSVDNLYYPKNWPDEIFKLQELSGFKPHEDQVAQMFFHYYKTYSNAYNPLKTALTFLDEKVGKELDESLAQKICVLFLEDQNLKAIEQLKAATKIALHIPEEVLKKAVDDRLKDVQDHKMYDELLNLQRVLELEHLPATASVVQDAYSTDSSDIFKIRSLNEKHTLFRVYALTGIHPEYSQEQLDDIYSQAEYRDWAKLYEVFGKAASSKACQNKYFDFLLAGSTEKIAKLKESSGVDLEEDTVQRAFDFCARKAKISQMKKISEITAIDPAVSNESIQEGYLFLFNFSFTYTSTINDVDYFQDTLNVPPSKEVISYAFQKIFRETYHHKKYENVFPEKWELLKQKFGTPSSEVFQKVYFKLISTKKVPVNHLDLLSSFCGMSPNLDEMESVLKNEGIEREQIEQTMQSYYKSELLKGRVENIEKHIAQLPLAFQVSGAEAQLLYAQILMGKKPEQKEMLSFMKKHSGYEPAADIVKNRYDELLAERDLDGILELRKLTGKNSVLSVQEVKEEFLVTNHGDLIVQGLNHHLFNDYYDLLIDQIGKNNFGHYLPGILSVLDDSKELQLNKADIHYFQQSTLNSLSFYEINDLKRVRPLEESSLHTSEDAEKVYLVLKGNSEEWKDSEICKRVEAGTEVFGYHRMLAFAKPKQRHDAYYGFDRIIDLYEISGLKPEHFYHNILQQVAMDSGTYGEYGDTAYQTLNAIAQGFQDDIPGVLEEARQIKGIPQLDALIKNIKSPKDVFSSWRMLMQYKELTTLLERREILDELSQEENDQLRNYVSTLLFHPSVTDTHAVKLFWKDPYEFFGLESSHTEQEAHDLKKPSNYVHIPHLDLSPAELRDALIDGTLDKIQVWKPLEASYEVPINPKAWAEYMAFLEKPLSTLLQEALGTEARGIKNKKKLFGKIRTIIEAQLDPQQYPQTRKAATGILQKLVKGEEVDEVLLFADVQKDIRDAIYFGEYGYSKKMKTNKYLVKINLKSNPDGVVAGNDTQCCMPFGDGKNTLYSYNPICALMTVQREISDSNYRTIAQSVLTKDKDIKTSTASLIARLEKGESNRSDLAELLPHEILHKERSIIACDSVEVANNYKSAEYSELLANLYRDFLQEYISQFGEEQHLDPNKAVLGICTYDLEGTSNEPNTFLAESPVAYSDKYGDAIEVLTLQEKSKNFFATRNISVTELEKNRVTSLQNPNIDYLTFQDSLETAYIEGKAYEETSLKQGIAEMENALIAKDINNAAKDRDNMSLKYVSGNGQMQAYLVAYEGKYGHMFEYEDEYYEDEREEHEKCIYVMDIAKLPESKKGVGRELINEFIRLYQENYIKKNKLIPIKAEAREVSSYKLIMRHLDDWGKSIGIRFELEEAETYQKGEDLMHPVTIRPTRIKNEFF